jgi:hypothetical protein
MEFFENRPTQPDNPSNTVAANLLEFGSKLLATGTKTVEVVACAP